MPFPIALVVKNGSKIRFCTSSGTGPIVVHLEDHGVTFGLLPRAKDERAAAVCVEHRLLGVDDEVQQDLLDLVRIGKDGRKARGQRLEDHDVRDALLMRPQRQRFADHLIEVHRRPGRVTLPGERLQVAHDAGGALGGVVDGVEIPARQLVEPAARQPLGAEQDRRERIVQLVRHPDIVWPSAASFSACESW